MIEREKVLDLINDKLERLESMIRCYEYNMDKIESEYKENHGGDLDIYDCEKESEHYERLWKWYEADENAMKELSDLVYEVCEL